MALSTLVLTPLFSKSLELSPHSANRLLCKQEWKQILAGNAGMGEDGSETGSGQI